jgi:hypothetical protein
MYDYAVVIAVRPDNYHAIVREYEQQNYTLHESNHYREFHYGGGSAIQKQELASRWTLVFRRPSADISYGQLLINRHGDKLRSVAEYLLSSKGLSGIETTELGNDIKEFLFKGSPEDM